MSGPRLNWKGDGRYDWRSEWPVGKDGDVPRLLIVKLLVKNGDGTLVSKIVAVR